ncbi:MAG TPA: hypothetical protein VIH61_02245 [Waddliaceae bacterium]
MKKILLFLLLLGGGYTLFLLAIWHLTEGFSVAKISSDLPYSSRWEVVGPSEKEAKALLMQNFYYLGRGSQCYVFESEDKQIVLKFFRLSRYRLPHLAKHITSPPFLVEIQNQKKRIKQRKLDALFQSCKIAYEQMQNETGLVYLHLNKTTSLKTVVIYDKLKRPYCISLDNYAFIIQKRGEHIFPYLASLLKKGRTEEAQEALADLVTLIATRLNKGIADHDAVIHKNSGFRENRAFFLDVGEFTYEPSIDHDQELWQSTTELRAWLNEKDPQLAGYFEFLLHNQKTVFS